VLRTAYLVLRDRGRAEEFTQDGSSWSTVAPPIGCPTGLHFRDAMDDGYLLGHTVADQVIGAIR
jgi:hypothetical protein